MERRRPDMPKPESGHEGTDGGVIIYDGQCAFCRRQIERIRRRDRLGQFDYYPFEDDRVAERYGHLELASREAGMRFITPDERVYTGADAVYQIARRIAVWRPLAWLYRVPGGRRVFRWIYTWIAGNRHRFGSTCGTASCRS